jgi:arginine-tRNA-protein transferase
VYFFFDPEESRRSLGVFSVLQELRLCERLGMEHLYLGLHVEDCRELSYKAAYHPHERLTPGGWRRFERG